MSYLLITSLIWAFSYGLIKTKLNTLDPNFITLMRMLIAALVFLPFLRPKQLNFYKALIILAIGSVQFGLMYLFFLPAFKYLNAYQAALFTTMTPLYVILINNLWRKKFNLTNLSVVLGAVIGGIVIYYTNLQQHNIFIGFWLVQASDLCFAIGQVAYKIFRQHYKLDDKKVYALMFIGALMPAVIATFVTNGFSNLAVLTSKQLAVLIYLGAIASGICFFMWNKGALMVNTTTLAVFNNLKSPLAIAVSLIFFHESTNLIRLTLGLMIITGALFIAQRTKE